jgi:hypothetical protein
MFLLSNIRQLKFRFGQNGPLVKTEHWNNKTWHCPYGVRPGRGDDKSTYKSLSRFLVRPIGVSGLASVENRQLWGTLIFSAESIGCRVWRLAICSTTTFRHRTVPYCTRYNRLMTSRAVGHTFSHRPLKIEKLGRMQRILLQPIARPSEPLNHLTRARF